MQKIIQNLRSKPIHVRAHILNVSVLVSAIILGLVWLWSFGSTVTSPDNGPTVSENNNVAPLSALKANLIGGIQSISQPDATNGQ